MCCVLRRHLERKSKYVQKGVFISEGDMRTFRSNRKYPLVTIPFRPLQHMHTLEEKIDAIKTAAFHLEENGILAFDVFYPKFEWRYLKIGEEYMELEWYVQSDPTKFVPR